MNIDRVEKAVNQLRGSVLEHKDEYPFYLKQNVSASIGMEHYFDQGLSDKWTMDNNHQRRAVEVGVDRETLRLMIEDYKNGGKELKGVNRVVNLSLSHCKEDDRVKAYGLLMKMKAIDNLKAEMPIRQDIIKVLEEVSTKNSAEFNHLNNKNNLAIEEKALKEKYHFGRKFFNFPDYRASEMMDKIIDKEVKGMIYEKKHNMFDGQRSDRFNDIVGKVSHLKAFFETRRHILGMGITESYGKHINVKNVFDENQKKAAGNYYSQAMGIHQKEQNIRGVGSRM